MSTLPPEGGAFVYTIVNPPYENAQLIARTKAQSATFESLAASAVSAFVIGRYEDIDAQHVTRLTVLNYESRVPTPVSKSIVGQYIHGGSAIKLLIGGYESTRITPVSVPVTLLFENIPNKYISDHAIPAVYANNGSVPATYTMEN
jgi:hypothetical protein